MLPKFKDNLEEKSKKVVLVQPDSTNCLPKDTDFQLECEKKHLGLKEYHFAIWMDLKNFVQKQEK